MTRTWVVYESMFGNTRQVASAIAEELGTAGPVELHEVSKAGTLPPDLDLLIVGAPTHAFGLSRPSSRDDASNKSGHPVESALMGVREWLETVEPGPTGTAFATFDTRVSHPRVPGSAAKKAAKRLRKLGLTQAAEPESFWVHGMEGPLDAGELERTRVWARGLAEATSGPPVGEPVG